jgi:hypothetical protein
VPEVYQKLSVPGCDPIYIRMTDDFQQQDKIKEVLSEAKIGKITLLLPEYKKEYVRVDQSNQGDSYSEQRMDLSEKDKNILDLNDLAYSKKDTA